MDQLTAMFEVPLTVGVKVALWPPLSDVLPGERVTLTIAGDAAGCNMTETVAVLPGSAALAAVTAIVSGAGMLAGAV